MSLSYRYFSHSNLDGFLHEVLGVAPEDAVAYLSNGIQLTNENIRELAGSNDDVRVLSTVFGGISINSFFRKYLYSTSIILTTNWRVFYRSFDSILHYNHMSKVRNFSFRFGMCLTLLQIHCHLPLPSDSPKSLQHSCVLRMLIKML